ncbi:MAG: glycoside hydrolase [Anaerolineales bacterium]|nr:glycoside hydrolase [Anaerolineales bacterium]
MTRHHSHITLNSEYGRNRAGDGKNLALTRREFLQTGMVLLSGALLPQFLADLGAGGLAQEFSGKRIYIAPDDHTDLFWTADLPAYEQAFLDMLDYYLDLADQTQNEPPEFQSRWNCDGSFWVWVYEKRKPPAEFNRLIERIRSGHISMPLNALCVCLGGAPAEAVLRGMYYPGKLERRHNLRFPIAYSMENQTLPLGLGALWAGSGATFSWKGICDCATKVPDAWDREHDIYWWVGPDGSRLLMKWNSMLTGNQGMGGYAEARRPQDVVLYVDSDEAFKARYPYQVIGAFGHGWDDLQTQTDEFVTAAKTLSSQNFKVIVSNEIDFAQDFEKTYGNDIPSLTASFGNEWDLDCASLAEVSARVKRAVEKLRAAESLAALVSLKRNDFMQGREAARDQAWMNLGMYWEHNFQGAPWENHVQNSIAWHRKAAGEVETYVNTLHDDALQSLGGMIQKNGANERFFAFNPLGWARTDYADYPYDGAEPVHVVSVEDDKETPSQFIVKEGKRFLRVLAENVPSLGYKVFEIRPGAGQPFSSQINVSGGVIENRFYKVTVDGRGAVTSLIDKTRGNRELAAEVNGRFINDLGPASGNLTLEHAGAVSATLLASADSPLTHETRITLFRDVERIEIRNDITQNFNATSTWGFGFALQNPNVHHEEVGAILLARLTSDGGHYSPRNARYDWLTLNHFVDISGEGAGVTLSNADCYFMKVGNSTVERLDTSTPQISVLIGGNDLNGGGVLGDQGGDERFLQRFALRPHSGYDPVSAMKFALEHQNPLTTGRVQGGGDYPEASFSLLSQANPNVLLWALKPAEDGLESGLVARVWNLSAQAESHSISFDGGIAEALALTHIETPTGIADVEDGRLADLLNPQQLKTYALFPSSLPYRPDTSGLERATATPPAVLHSPTAVSPTETAAPAPVTNTPPPPSFTQTAEPVEPSGKGCLFGVLYVLGLLK